MGKEEGAAEGTSRQECINSSNPFHECSHFCLRKIEEAKRRLDDEWKRPPEERTVHPDCINASNPYNDCSEYCFKRIAGNHWFSLRQRNGNNGDCDTVEIKVYDYFVKNRGIELRYSGNLPCINVGKPKRPTYFPIELCTLLPLQRYTKALSTLQRSSLVEKSRQKPQERMSVLSDVLRRSNYDSDPMLRACGISIAQILPKLKEGSCKPPRLLRTITKVFELVWVVDVESGEARPLFKYPEIYSNAIFDMWFIRSYIHVNPEWIFCIAEFECELDFHY